MTFLENDFPTRGEIDRDYTLYEMGEPISSIIPTREDQGSFVDPSPSGSNPLRSEVLPEQPRRSSRSSVPKRHFDIEGEAFIVTPEDDKEPKSVNEALTSPAKDHWRNAMEEEMESMRINEVWDLVDLPKGRRPVGNKWVLKVKRNADGSIERYKARLVAKGYTQLQGIDYEETFSPVAKFTSIRLIRAIFANLDLELHQMDVKTAFLNGELDEEIYMEQPVGFVLDGQEDKVCRLLKSVYGLKQSSRQWYLRFHHEVISYGFVMIEEDHCVYIKRSQEVFIIMSLYVDDILLAGNSKEYLMTIKEWFSSRFDMKDLGEANYILEVKIQRDRSRRVLALSQEPYIKKVLERFRMVDCKPMDTPIAKGETLSLKMCPKTREEQKDMERVPYASAVCSLMYAMLCTRPDICFAIGLVSRYQSNPGRGHWRAVKRILRYLKGTANFSLCYGGEDLLLKGYADADWSGDLDERKSTSGFAFLLNNGAISWSSKKQTCIALSTMEADFVACSVAGRTTHDFVWKSERVMLKGHMSCDCEVGKNSHYMQVGDVSLYAHKGIFGKILLEWRLVAVNGSYPFFF